MTIWEDILGNGEEKCAHIGEKITVITNQNNELIAYHRESDCQERCMGPADENSHILLSDSSPGPSVVIRR